MNPAVCSGPKDSGRLYCSSIQAAVRIVLDRLKKNPDTTLYATSPRCDTVLIHG